MMARYASGEYVLINKEKYLGTKTPYYRSSWELRVFTIFDKSPSILKWGSETVIIPYYIPGEARQRRYIVDLFAEYLDKNGGVIKELIEIKPLKETMPPKNTKNKSRKTLLIEALTYQKNKAKWIAAALFAQKRNMRFRLLTENDIYPQE